MADRNTLASSAVNAARGPSVRSLASMRPGLDPREIQQRVHEPQQAQGVAVRDLLPFPMHGRQRRFRVGQPVFERSDQQRQRRAELVADVAEERRLRAIELRQRLGPLSLLLVRPRVGERRAELVGDQIDETRGTDRRTGAAD